MDERTTDEMADMTRKLAREEGPDDGDKAGSHGFPAAVGPGGVPLGQHGIGQSDNVSGQAPASGMAQQKANPAIRRDGEVDGPVGDGTKASSD
ncbi:MAG: hypothetical protein JWL76_28 [Thermoleophilia bacterium]|nr:hypothetical protein [Thermoleophilia bacterium]